MGSGAGVAAVTAVAAARSRCRWGFHPMAGVVSLKLNFIRMKTNQMQAAGRILALVVSAVLLAAIGTGCNTTRGFGRDVERTGEHIQAGVRG